MNIFDIAAQQQQQDNLKPLQTVVTTCWPDIPRFIAFIPGTNQRIERHDYEAMQQALADHGYRIKNIFDEMEEKQD